MLSFNWNVARLLRHKYTSVIIGNLMCCPSMSMATESKTYLQHSCSMFRATEHLRQRSGGKLGLCGFVWALRWHHHGWGERNWCLVWWRRPVIYQFQHKEYIFTKEKSGGTVAAENTLKFSTTRINWSPRWSFPVCVYLTGTSAL